MKEREEKKTSGDRHARNIPSKQDKSWVSEHQMQQEQFDKTELEREKGDGLKRKCKK